MKTARFSDFPNMGKLRSEVLMCMAKYVNGGLEPESVSMVMAQVSGYALGSISRISGHENDSFLKAGTENFEHGYNMGLAGPLQE